MTIDKNRLKALAEAAHADLCDWQPDFGLTEPQQAFSIQAGPATILGLLGEIAELQDTMSLVKDEDLKWKGLREQESEIKQLKAENEALRKARVPAGLYRELVALRQLRDQAKAYVDGYLLDEVEDVDSCVSEDQHLSASALSECLMNAFEAHWDSAMAKEAGK